MKTIKRERRVRLDELLKHVWGNKIKDKSFKDNSGNYIIINVHGELNTNYSHIISKEDTFIIEEEVEITKDSKLNKMISIDSSGRAYTHDDISIKGAIAFHEEEEEEESFYSPCRFIYLQNEDVSIGELIWSKERGLDV